MTHYRKLFDEGKYLGAWHLPADRDAIVEIEAVAAGVLERGQQKTRKPILRLRGKKLLFALNKTNAKTIATMYGQDIEKWSGKPIALYVGTTRDPDGGGQCACVRVRPRAPGAGTKGGEIDETATASEPQEEAQP